MKVNYFSVIPAAVRYSNISANAKLLYGEITALMNIEGECDVTNSYFSNLYKVNPNTITTWVKQLTSYGFIFTKQSHTGRRIITLSENIQIIKEAREIKPKKDNTDRLKKFEEFWTLYNKKIGKEESKSKFLKLTDKEVSEVIAAVPNYVKSTPDVQFRKHPKTWLNGKNWQDDIDTSKSDSRNIGSIKGGMVL